MKTRQRIRQRQASAQSCRSEPADIAARQRNEARKVFLTSGAPPLAAMHYVAASPLILPRHSNKSRRAVPAKTRLTPAAASFDTERESEEWRSRQRGSRSRPRLFRTTQARDGRQSRENTHAKHTEIQHQIVCLSSPEGGTAVCQRRVPGERDYFGT